jgi:dihydrofolate reductase
VSSLVVYMTMSLDGFVAAADDGPRAGLGVGGEILHDWLSEGDVHGDSHRPPAGVNAEIFDEMLATGAVVTGRNTFEYAGQWAGDHHGGVPIFVLTRQVPEPAVAGNVHYVDDPAALVAQAKAAAGDRDVMMHGASAVQSLLRAGLVDELQIHLVPLLLGRGRRLFDELPRQTQQLRLIRSVQGDGVLHLRYRIEREPAATQPADRS